MTRPPKDHTPARVTIGAVNTAILLWLAAAHSSAILTFLGTAAQSLLYILLGVAVVGVGSAAYLLFILSVPRGR